MKFRFYLLAFLCVLLNSKVTFSADKFPQAKNGVIDLSQLNFSEVVPLNGEWEFYWLQFRAPGDSSAKQAVSQIVDFPVNWNKLSVDGKNLPSFGFATYRLRLVLPDDFKEDLRVDIPDVYTSYRMYFNGEMVAENGKIGKSKLEVVPHWQHRVFDIPVGTKTAEFVLQISNFEHSKGGIKDQLLIAKKSVMALKNTREDAIDLLLTGCLFMGGLFFFGLYLSGNRDKAILLFSLFSMSYCYRIMGTDNYVLHSVLPNLSWYLTIQLEYITLFISIGLFALYTKTLYPEDVRKSVIVLLISICILFVLITLLFPAYYYSHLVNPFLVVTLYWIAYALLTYVKAFKNKRPGSTYGLMSAGALMLTFSISILSYWGVVNDLQILSFIGYVVFFFFQSLILSYRVSFQLKKARAEAEQGLIAKSEFLSTMSHEIRTPLNSVIGMGHLLLKNNPRKDQEEQLDIMLYSANNLLGIVNDILDYNKMEAGKIELDYVSTNVIAIARNIVVGLNNLATEKGIDLKLTVDPRIQNKVYADSTRLFQVLTNLVHNAVKFTDRGRVEVKLNVVEETEQTMTIQFQVIDTGIGISKEDQKIIFDRFTQADSSASRSFEGTGLGLAISKRILDLQGGRLSVFSESGKGATFSFELAFEKTTESLETETGEMDKAHKEERSLAGYPLLLVEDNAINVLVAKSFLEKWGATVDVATNGEEALQMLRPAEHRLILMDLHMPVMDGYEASRQIREQNPTIPIIALTANLKKDIETKLNEVGINDIITKPFLPDELYFQVSKYLKKRLKS